MSFEKLYLQFGYLLVLIILLVTIGGIFGQFLFIVKILPFIVLFILTLLAIPLIFNIKQFVFTSKYEILIFICLTIFCFVNASFYHETISGSRDDGAYSMNAVYLAYHGTNTLNLLPKAQLLLGEPGNLGFLPGYHSYLAIFMYYFGLKNMLMYANALLYLFSITCIYLVGKNLYGRKIAFISTFFFITNFVSLWFSRRTNNENLGLFLFWFAVLLLINILKNKNYKNFIFLIPTLITFFFVRGESLLLIIPVLFIVFIILIRNRFKVSISRININKLLSAVFLLNLFIAIFSIYSFGIYYKNNHAYFEESAKTIKLFMTATLGRIGSTSVKDLKTIENIRDYTPPIFQDFTTHATRYVFDVLKAYFLIQLLVFGLFSLKKININIVTLIVMTSPFFIFLIYPSITPDNPWMMRKYWIAFIPFVYIIFGFLLKNSNLQRRIKIILIFFILLIQLNLSLPVIAFSENRGLINSLDKLIKKMPDADLIITPTGDYAGLYYPIWINYYIPSQMPYFNKNFQDKLKFDNLISNFKNVYILSSNWNNKYINFVNFSYPSENVEKVDEITISIPSLAPVGKEFDTTKEYSYDFVKNIINNLPPKQILFGNTKIIILKLKH